MLSLGAFKQALLTVPLVSIDLLVQNGHGEWLLGKRTNKPARFWFVPGGRIRKDERVQNAFLRLTKEELGVEVDLNETDFHGVYQHLYEDSFVADDITQHHVALAYRLTLSGGTGVLPKQYHWLSTAELLKNVSVHDNVKAYFKANRSTVWQR